MIVVIQCAGSKFKNAGTMRDGRGKPVKFVAQPDPAPADGYSYARPDDESGQGGTWREMLLQYNNENGANPLGLARAFELYRPPVYQALAQQVGTKKLYILSAGWGLIRADFLTPDYDITFSAQARNEHAYKRRKRADRYEDFCMVPPEGDEPVLFFGGKDYLPLFTALTSALRAPRVVYYRSEDKPHIPGCVPVRYSTPRSTNWHYECAETFIAGDLDVPAG